MLRISKLTDYGTVVLACLATRPGPPTAPRPRWPSSTRLGPAHGQQAAEELPPGRPRHLHARRARRLSAGPRRPRSDQRRRRSSTRSRARSRSPSAAATTAPATSRLSCSTGNAWQRVNGAIRRSLDDISLAQLSRPGSRRRLAPGPGGARSAPLPVGRPGSRSEELADDHARNRPRRTRRARSTSTASSPTSSPTRVPPGLDEDVIRLISAQEGRAAVHARLAAARPTATGSRMQRARLGARALSADRLPGDLLLLGAEANEGRPEEPRRGRPEAARDLREARRAAARARAARRRGGGRGVRQRLGRDHVQGQARPRRA
ncbi:MAG: hypothetical protein MZV65_25650 [Chromatiales bacterium]|nr:hypothetical protein [Chromatiales bacterium]